MGINSTFSECLLFSKHVKECEGVLKECSWLFQLPRDKTLYPTFLPLKILLILQDSAYMLSSFHNPFLESPVKDATLFPFLFHIPNSIIVIMIPLMRYHKNQLNQFVNDYNDTSAFSRKEYLHNRGL